MQIIFLIFIFIVIPWLIYVIVKSSLESRRKEKAEEERRIAHLKNPRLKYIELINGRHGFVKLMNRRSQNYFARGGIAIEDFKKNFKTPYLDAFNKTEREISIGNDINEVDKTELMELLKSVFMLALQREGVEKEQFDLNRKKFIENEERKKIMLKSKHLHRRRIIEKLSGSNSFVLLDSTSNLISHQNFSFKFIFKSNIWENNDGTYVISGGDTYDEGVVNLFQLLAALKKSKKIKKIDNLRDPRTV